MFFRTVTRIKQLFKLLKLSGLQREHKAILKKWLSERQTVFEFIAERILSEVNIEGVCDREIESVVKEVDLHSKYATRLSIIQQTILIALILQHFDASPLLIFNTISLQMSEAAVKLILIAFVLVCVLNIYVAMQAEIWREVLKKLLAQKPELDPSGLLYQQKSGRWSVSRVFEPNGLIFKYYSSSASTWWNFYWNFASAIAILIFFGGVFVVFSILVEVFSNTSNLWSGHIFIGCFILIFFMDFFGLAFFRSVQFRFVRLEDITAFESIRKEHGHDFALRILMERVERRNGK